MAISDPVKKMDGQKLEWGDQVKNMDGYKLERWVTQLKDGWL